MTIKKYKECLKYVTFSTFNFQLSTTLFLSLILLSCSSNKNTFDASGTFEAVETIVSSEATGIIKELNLEEGQVLHKGDYIGYVDSAQLYLKKKQLEAQIKALLGKRPNVSVQLAALQEQLKTAEKEKIRITNLVKSEAATAKQLDDINANIEVLKRQIEAQKSSLDISSEGIGRDASPLLLQIEQVNDQLQKCKIINPNEGTVLTKYVEENELATIGKPLYKIADLSNMVLRAYITGNQLPLVKLNQKVKVRTDDGKGGFNTTEGSITWINSKAEFTPKTIQTKDERANLVYAVKIALKNKGAYKIGMYGEIIFN